MNKKLLLMVGLACSTLNVQAAHVGMYGIGPGMNAGHGGGHYSISSKPYVSAHYANAMREEFERRREDLALIVPALRRHYEGKSPMPQEIGRMQYLRFWGVYDISPYRFGFFYKGRLGSNRKNMERSHLLREKALKEALLDAAPTPDEWERVFLPEGSEMKEFFDKVDDVISNREDDAAKELMKIGLNMETVTVFPSPAQIEDSAKRIVRKMIYDTRIQALRRFKEEKYKEKEGGGKVSEQAGALSMLGLQPPVEFALKFPMFIPRIDYWKKALNPFDSVDPSMLGIYRNDSQWLKVLGKETGTRFTFKSLAKQAAEDMQGEHQEMQSAKQQALQELQRRRAAMRANK